MGENVRYNGGHKYDSFLGETLGQFVEYVPVCPEVECGMGVPREPVRLVGDPEAPRLMTVTSGRDMTKMMLDWAGKRLKDLEKENLDGYIFKSKSPSSGMERVKIYNEKGNVHAKGAGMFAREFMNRFPLLPVEDEGRLHDPNLRENFIERVFTLHRYRNAMADARSLAPLMEFHASHKLLIMSHNQQACREMGRMLAGNKGAPSKALKASYEEKLLAALKGKATVRKHVNVLQHILGYFKEQLDADEKKEALDLIEAYRNSLVPLIVPITLLGHFARKYGNGYLLAQYYLWPHPLELKLRNHA